MFGYLVGLIDLGIWVREILFCLFVFVLDFRIEMVQGCYVINFTICILCYQPYLCCWILLMSYSFTHFLYELFWSFFYLFIGLLLDVSLHISYLNFLQQYILKAIKKFFPSSNIVSACSLCNSQFTVFPQLLFLFKYCYFDCIVNWWDYAPPLDAFLWRI